MHFRDRLRDGQPLLGTVVTLGTPQASELLARVGYDWLWIDMEHGPLELAMVQSLIQAAGSECASLVRVPSNDSVWLQRVLDLGPTGVIVPHVDSADDARDIMAACWYPPRGRRSVGIGRAQGYGLDLPRYLASSHESLVVMPQIEHADAVEDIDAILAVDGIDCVMVGPFDLSASLGHPGELDHPALTKAIRRVVRACRRAGKQAGIFAGTPEFAKTWRAEGFQVVAVGADVALLAGAASALLGALRSSE